MKNLTRIFSLLQILTLTIALSGSSRLIAKDATVRLMNDNSVEHAKELLGTDIFNRLDIDSLCQKTHQVNIKRTVNKSLRKKYKKYDKVILKTVVRVAKKYNFDPFFLLAVISGESSFNPHIVGTSGEIGLMQIRPTTAAWIAKKFKLKFKGAKSLKNPKINIQIGAAYLAYLRDKFEQESQLYLAAYNMGATNVKRAMRKKIKPRDYARHIMKRYIDFYKNLDREVVQVAHL